MKKHLLFLVLVMIIGTSYAQVGDLIWVENFDSLSNWNVITGNGEWGWGNGELQYYKQDNVSIAQIPGESGNNGLKIDIKQESGTGIVDQWGNPLNYTSGKVNSLANISVKYGMIETRIMIPDLNLGGWPAFWMLGTATYTWPRNGEMDIMEMGHTKVFRDLHDTHNGGNGADNSTVNQMVSSNALFYSDAAVTGENPSGAASLAYDPTDVFCRPYYNYSNPLINRFLIYRLYWDDQSIRFTVIDNGVEYDLFETPFSFDGESDEFNNPFYFLINCAIGGKLTDAYNLGDPGSGQPVSMSLPAQMYVDYIKVYKWNGQGKVYLGPPFAQEGTFGIFTDETPTDSSLVIDETAHIYVWEQTLVDGTIPAYEGDNSMSWLTNGKGWFGAGVMSIQPTNMFNFGDGNIKFKIKIPANVTFKIGIIDIWGNQNYVTFPANQTAYGLERNGDWGQASIPVSEIRGEYMDLRMLSYEFVILEEQGIACEFSLDDVYWDGGSFNPEEEEEETDLSRIANNGYGLSDCYPNPFSVSTTIAYTIPQTENVELTIYDITGRVVKNIVNKNQSAGTYTINWDASEQPSGVYFYKLKAGNYSETKKCIIK